MHLQMSRKSLIPITPTRECKGYFYALTRGKLSKECEVLYERETVKNI